MVQRAVRVGGVPPSADSSSSEGAEELGRDWIILRNRRLGRPARGGHLPAVLMNPTRGVAVLDILPSDTPGAVEALRARLGAARFPAIFAGHLPVVHLQVAPQRVPFLPALLDEAFAAQPPLDLPGGDAWVGVAARALTAEQPVPRLESSRRVRGDDAAGRRPRRTAAALRKAGAVLLCLAALGGVLGSALNKAPAPEAVPPATEEAVRRTPTPPALPPPVPGPVPVAPPPLPPAPAARSGAAAMVEPVPEALPPAPSPFPASAPPPRRPEAVAPPPPPPARRAPERTVPPRRQQQEAGTTRPAAGGADAAPRIPEPPPDRCRRVSALVGSGAPLAEADMRFFNENCIRW